MRRFFRLFLGWIGMVCILISVVLLFAESYDRWWIGLVLAAGWITLGIALRIDRYSDGEKAQQYAHLDEHRKGCEGVLAMAHEQVKVYHTFRTVEEEAKLRILLHAYNTLAAEYNQKIWEYGFNTKKRLPYKGNGWDLLTFLPIVAPEDIKKKPVLV